MQSSRRQSCTCLAWHSQLTSRPASDDEEAGQASREWAGLAGETRRQVAVNQRGKQEEGTQKGDSEMGGREREKEGGKEDRCAGRPGKDGRDFRGGCQWSVGAAAAAAHSAAAKAASRAQLQWSSDESDSGPCPMCTGSREVTVGAHWHPWGQSDSEGGAGLGGQAGE